MKIYTTGADAVADLHGDGFTNDFQLCGNDLYWVQEKILIRAGEFAILEYHKIKYTESGEMMIFGVLAHNQNIKGILLDRHKNYSMVTPPVITKKLNELQATQSLVTA